MEASDIIFRMIVFCNGKQYTDECFSAVANQLYGIEAIIGEEIA